MNIEPTPEELFYAKMAGSAVGDLESCARFLKALIKARNTKLITDNQLLDQLVLASDTATEVVEFYSKTAEDFSKACFLKRFELSGESPAAPKSQAN